MAKGNLFQRFEASLGEVAETWSTDTVELSKPSGTRDIHEEAAEVALERTLAREEALTVRFENGGVLHGMSVIERWLFHAAYAASLRHMSIGDLQKAIYHPASFEELQKIATRQNKIAARVESHFNLGHALFYTGEDLAADYIVDPRTGIALRGLKIEIVRQIYVVTGNGELDPGARCAAEKASVLSSIYHHLAKINLNDPRLTQAVLKS